MSLRAVLALLAVLVLALVVVLRQLLARQKRSMKTTAAGLAKKQ